MNAHPPTYSGIVLKLINNLLHEAKGAGANTIAVCCPLCQANLAARQHQIEEKQKTSCRLPILYIIQLMGLAFGARAKEVGIQKLITSPQEALGSVCLDVSITGRQLHFFNPLKQ